MKIGQMCPPRLVTGGLVKGALELEDEADVADVEGALELEDEADVADGVAAAAMVVVVVLMLGVTGQQTRTFVKAC